MTNKQPMPDVPPPMPGWPPEREVARLHQWLAAVTGDDWWVLDGFVTRIFAGADPQEAARATLAEATVAL